MQKIIFIFGCQRSGTSILSHLLSLDPQTFSYSEVDNELTDQDKSEKVPIRLNPLEDVREKLARRPEGQIVVKPLVESQRAKDILEYFPGSVAFWSYRTYQDAVQSMLTKWGPDIGVPHLRLVLAKRPKAWRSEGIPEYLTELVARMLREDLNPQDGAALFWYVRNELFFLQNLDKDGRCFPMRYESMVTDPDYFEKALSILDIGYQGPDKFLVLNPNSIGKGADLAFHDGIAELCNDMWERLELAHNTILRKNHERAPQPPHGLEQNA